MVSIATIPETLTALFCRFILPLQRSVLPFYNP